MSAKLKNIFLIFLSCLVVLSMSMIALGSSTVKADADSFTMVSGAQLRLNTENNGIRFQAKIGANVYDSVKGENGAYFGMIVVPESYFKTFEEELTLGENDYVPVLTTALESKGYSLWNRTNIEPYQGYQEGQSSDYYYINGVVSNILYDNYNVDRVAIAYYKNSTGYHYADGFVNNGEYNSRSVGELAKSALKDTVTQYTTEQRDVINKFNYLADSKANGVTEKTANEKVDAYVSYVKNAVLTGNQVANFDGVDSLPAIVDETSSEYVGVATSEYLANGYDGVTSGVVKFSVEGATNYGGKAIKFAKGVTVTNDTVVQFKYYLESDAWFRIKGYGVDTTTHLTSWSALTDEWAIKAVKATNIGYTVGDYMDGIELFVRGSSCYVDEILVTENATYDLSKDLILDTNDNGEVANFDNILYALDADGFNYVDDGETKALAIQVNSGVSKTVKVIKPVVVSDGDKLEIRVKSPVAKFRMNNISNNSAGRTESTYADYTVLTFDVITDLGYKPGEILSSISFKNQGQNCSGVVYVDYVKIINIVESAAKGLIGNQIANYDNADDYAKLLPSITLDTNYTANEVAFDGNNGYWKYATSNGYNRQKLTFAPSKVEGKDYYAYNVVPADDADVEGYLLIKIKTGATTIRIMHDSYRDEGAYYTNTLFDSTASDWTYVKTGDWQIVMIPVVNLGYQSGEAVNHVSIAHWQGVAAETEIDWIEYVELDKDLNKNQAINAYVQKYRDGILTDFENTNDSLIYNYAKGNVTNGVYSYTGSNWAKSSIKFIPQIVSDTSCIKFRLKLASDMRTTLVKKDGSSVIDIVHPTSTTIDTITKGHYNKSAISWITVTVLVTELGYNVDDVVDSITLCNQNSGENTIYLDNIIWFESDLDKKELITFDDEQLNYANYIKTINVAYSNNNTYNYHGLLSSATVVKYGEEGYLGAEIDGNGVLKVKPSSSNYGGIAVVFNKLITVAEDTKIVIRVYNPSGSTLSVTKLGDTTSIGTQVSGLTGATWCDITVNASVMGYSVGDIMRGAEIYFYGTNLYIDSITLA